MRRKSTVQRAIIVGATALAVALPVVAVASVVTPVPASGAASDAAVDHTAHAATALAERFPGFSDFVAARDELDPDRTFASSWTRRVLGD